MLARHVPTYSPHAMEQQNNFEKYGTPEAWAQELGIASKSIKIRLQRPTAITGRNAKGHIIYDNFYSESNVRTACADLLRDVPKADSSGFFYLPPSGGDESEKYGSVKTWAREFNLNEKTLLRRLQGNDAVTGKDSRGHVLENGFYAEQTIRQCCKDVMQDVPRIDKEGVFL